MKINSITDLQHLSNRVCIGGIGLQKSLNIGQSVDILSFFPKNIPTYSKPSFDFVQSQALAISEAVGEEKKELISERRAQIISMGEWWLDTLQHTEFPLLERMTLFWHGHFTTSAGKVSWPELIYNQNNLFRKYALGSFSELLHSICLDPAMLIYLDASRNSADQPNENFARELLELFTLGEGHYSEADIIAAARAFTGWGYNVKKNQVQFNKKKHDFGVKVFLGKQGNFDAKDIINILLDTPRVSEFITEKLWRVFVSNTNVKTEQIKRFAKRFKESNYSIKFLLLDIFDSEDFWSISNRGVLIKNPVEFTVGLIKELQLDDFDRYKYLYKINSQLGMQLFYPPDVKGWPIGNRWLNDSTYLLRRKFVRDMLREFDHIQSESQCCSNLSLNELKARFLVMDSANYLKDLGVIEKNLLNVLDDPTYQLR